MLRIAAFATALSVVSLASAAPVLQITEIFPGVSTENSSNVTADWFELTNLGDMPWVFATDGSLFYEDENPDPLKADLMTLPGSGQIDPGQSVVFVNDGTAGRDEFLQEFPSVDPAIVGYFEGSGLGGGGDTANVFTGDSLFPDDGIENETLLASASYPDQDLAVANGIVPDGSTWDSYIGKWTRQNDPNVINSQSLTVIDGNGTMGPIIATPGRLVPEPSSIAIAALAVLGLAAARFRS